MTSLGFKPRLAP
uniref:Uncharacterized protein n=1 Tax=Arundo donax TaxID=35708 RepID=A0A0A8Z181_ARUDO